MTDKLVELHCHIYQNKLGEIAESSFLPAELLGAFEQHRIIEAISQLPNPINEVIEAYYIQGKRIKEIGAALQLKTYKVYRCLHQGKYLLRLQLNPSYYDKAREIMYGHL